MSEKVYVLNVYNTMTGQYELIQVTKEVFQTYRRTKWNIEDSTERFFKHETQMSSLIGGENDGYERFHEFIDYDNTPENQAIEEMVFQSLHNVLELLPPKEGEIAQKTEDLVGPYELHDFFLYYTLRLGYGPEKIFRLACVTFEGAYDKKTIAKWLNTFFRRFFAQQFKRSCLPDGPKVGTVSVSPRGDLRMPSDASRALWQTELDRICDCLV